MVWTALFACFGVAWARLRGLPKERRLADGLWLMCVAYPLHTDGIRSRAAACAGNAVIAGMAGAIVARARQKGRNDAAFVLPVLPWVAWAALTLLTERRRR